jgi:hypothetical protein
VFTLFLRYESKPRIDREFNDGELADIEMTISPQAFETLRVEFYVCRLFTTQDIRGTAKHYRDLKHTFFLYALALASAVCSPVRDAAFSWPLGARGIGGAPRGPGPPGRNPRKARFFAPGAKNAHRFS